VTDHARGVAPPSLAPLAFRTRITQNSAKRTTPVPDVSTLAYIRSSCSRFSGRAHSTACWIIAARKSAFEIEPSPSTSNLQKFWRASSTSAGASEPRSHSKEPSGWKTHICVGPFDPACELGVGALASERGDHRARIDSEGTPAGILRRRRRRARQVYESQVRKLASYYKYL